eukprot:TRINITY_DN4265_c0_g1_i1.p1 TRINITY_DN4265_c0_g1~~TRINITY_DN4265_c0_g1_i1.p1  ORF type:complete len:723 (+),score=226.45 TRINITY_DN4265_c0_g1_i1:219-2171(+)
MAWRVGEEGVPPPPDVLPGFTRAEFEDTCKRRFIYGAGFEAYGGAAGLYDLGPVGCAVKTNLLAMWRRHFVVEDGMLEVDTSALTPHEVFAASGHVQRFTDVLVQDAVTGAQHRLDKYLDEWCDARMASATPAECEELTAVRGTFETWSLEQMAEFVTKWRVASPEGNPLHPPKDFNLMFPTPIGPAGDRTGYLRPELAQGIILNFNRLLEFNGGRMPFAGACVGAAFRNEIAPRNNLLRVREFTLAEIEHFCHPDRKEHEKFASVADLEMYMWTAEAQSARQPVRAVRLGDAVADKTIANETLGYYIGRAALFLRGLGIRHARLRQHLPQEMAHYAADCWDVEVLTSFGWVECVGIADRAGFDLTCHAEETKTSFLAYERYPTPRVETVLVRHVDKRAVFKAFQKDGPAVLGALAVLSDPEAEALAGRLAAGEAAAVEAEGGVYCLAPEMYRVAWEKQTVEGYHYTPSVVEPSFGVGRLVYALLEQAYYVRRETAPAEPVAAPGKAPKKKKKQKGADNEKRAAFALSPRLAPYKVALLPLSASVAREAYCQEALAALRAGLGGCDVEYKVDAGSQTIGKRYSRADEIGVPYAVTIDTAYPDTALVTLRERDSMDQVFVSVADAVEAVHGLCVGRRTWASVTEQYEVKSA